MELAVAVGLLVWWVMREAPVVVSWMALLPWRLHFRLDLHLFLGGLGSLALAGLLLVWTFAAASLLQGRPS